MIKKILEETSKSEKISFLVTLSLCILFIIIGIFVPVKKKEKYEPIQITLSSYGSDLGNKDIKSKTASESKKEVKQESSKQEVVKQEVKTATTKTNSTPAKTSSSTKQKAAKVREEKIYESVESLMAKQNSTKKEVEWDESLFADDGFFWESSSVSSNSTSTNSTSTNSVNNSNQSLSNPLSGSAAIITEEISSVAATTSASSTVNNVAQDYFENQGNESISQEDFDLGVMESEIDAVQSINGVSISWGTEKSRKIISPKNPRLVISEKNQGLITASKNLVLSFTVLANGNVTMSSFQVKPAGALPKVIEDELRSQVLSWRFEARDTSSKAQLNYRIEVK